MIVGGIVMQEITGVDIDYTSWLKHCTCEGKRSLSEHEPTCPGALLGCARAQLAVRKRECRDLEQKIIELREALIPFGHPDLNKLEPNDVMGDERVILMRGNAVIRAKDFKRAMELSSAVVAWEGEQDEPNSNL